MKKHKVIQSFQYNDNFKKWFWFSVETIVAAFVGALIAFVFGNHYWAALIAFGILMIFLIILCVFLIILENKVSILSIMNQGLKDGKYEDVIKFGSAMRTTLFTSNKNEDIVTLGYKIDEAASKIERAHYNRSKGDYQVTIDGKQQSITQIRIGLKIDDLGWSMHLSKRNDEAATNIIAGMRQSRSEALRLARLNEKQPGKAITPFVKLILRGYRHLCGIYYEDVNQHWRANFYENVTRLIMSNYKIISQGGVCENRKNNSSDITCGLFCGSTYEEKVDCDRNNILNLYYKVNTEIIYKSELDIANVFDFLKISDGSLMSEVEIEDDIKLFNMLPIEIQNDIVKDQCYAWGRNMVKKIQNGMYKQGEYDFISDDELSCKVAEARAFSQVYYYGTDPVAINDDFDNVINKDIVGKSELRYLSLMNEIELVNLFQPLSRSSQKRHAVCNSGRNIKVDKLINNLKLTQEICRDKRADLYIRASIHLITAYYHDYNLNYRFITHDVIDKSLESRKQKLAYYKKLIRSLYKEIKSYEHKANDDLEQKYHFVMGGLKVAEKQLKRKHIKTSQRTNDFFIDKFTNIDPNEYKHHTKLSRIGSALYHFSDNDIKRVKTKWGI